LRRDVPAAAVFVVAFGIGTGLIADLGSLTLFGLRTEIFFSFGSVNAFFMLLLPLLLKQAAARRTR
jgi:hypothetical protein